MHVFGSARWTALVVGFIVMATACGDSNDDEAADASASPEAQGSSELAEARAAVEELSQPIESIGIDEPLESLPTGQSVVVVFQPIPGAQQSWDAFREAARELGLDVTFIEGGSTPEEFAAGVRRAVDMDPDLIAAQTFPPAVYEDVLQPYVDGGGLFFGSAFGTNERHPLVSVSYQTNDHLAEVARAKARWVAVDAGGADAKILSHWLLDFPSQVRMLEAFEEELATVCPTCEHTGESVKFADLGTALPGQVVSYFQRNPDTEYYVAGYGDIAFGIPEAFDAAGITGVRAISSFGTPANHQMVADGELFVADLTQSWPVLGWVFADAAARLVTGQDVPVQEPFGSPFRWLTTDTIDFDVQDFFEPDFDWRAEFRALWGV